MMRPYFDEHGERCVRIRSGRMVFNNKKGVHEPIMVKARISDLMARGIYSPVFNATSLRKEEWIQLDQVVLREARLRLRAWADLANANSFGGFNGMAKEILEHETMSDPGQAQVDMDGLTEGRNDSPKFQLEGIPLPITHMDFWYSSRRLATSRNTGTPLDTTTAEAAGRRVAEQIEQTLIGTAAGITYGGASTYVGGYSRASTVYGYTNFPDRLTKTDCYKPTGVGSSGNGWVAKDTLQDVLTMRSLLYANRFYGPFMLYHSIDWDQYLDNDYILTGGNVATQTLRERLAKTEGISDVRRLDFLPGPFTMILVQMTPDVARAINGMEITTIQWESVGGMRLNFKCLAIQVPQLRATQAGRCGIAHMTCSH
jgi:hypothetical protein